MHEELEHRAITRFVTTHFSRKVLEALSAVARTIWEFAQSWVLEERAAHLGNKPSEELHLGRDTWSNAPTYSMPCGRPYSMPEQTPGGRPATPEERRHLEALFIAAIQARQSTTMQYVSYTSVFIAMFLGMASLTIALDAPSIVALVVVVAFGASIIAGMLTARSVKKEANRVLDRANLDVLSVAPELTYLQARLDPEQEDG